MLQSGSVFGPWAVSSSDLTAPLRLAEKLGYETEDVSEAVRFLARADPKVVVGATRELWLGFGPCLEKQFDGQFLLLRLHLRLENVVA